MNIPNATLFIQYSFSISFVFALPHRDAAGRRVIFYRASAFDPNKNMNYNILRAIGSVIETLLEEEENQIRGISHVIDLSGLGLNYLTVFTPSQVMRLFKNAEVNVNHAHFLMGF